MKKYSTLKKFVEESSKGDRFIYYTGFLVKDRQEDVKLDKLADLALEYYQRGLVELCQTRISSSMYAYIAVRTNDVGFRYFTGSYLPEDLVTA